MERDPSNGGEQASPFPPELDGATPNTPPLSADVLAQRKISSDPSLPLDERLEAFEDIVDSEVGDTLLVRARNIEREYGLRQIWLKFEGGNPTGSQKDRIAFAQCMDAMRRGFDAITVATCGNYGAALSMAAGFAGLRCVVFIPREYHTRRLEEIVSQGAEVVRCDGDYEASVDRSREYAANNEVYDANAGGTNSPLQLQAYGGIAYELYDELRDAPAAVAVAVSNGTTLAGIHKGFLSLYRRGKTSRMPRMLAGSAFHKNPIVEAFIKKLQTCEELPPSNIHETRINEPLVNWRSLDGDAALWSIRETSGSACHVSDKRMMALSRTLREKEGLNVLPASTAGLHALLARHAENPLPGDRYVAILTGRKQ